MNQDKLRAALSALGAGAALADVGATLARLADPLEAKPRAPVSSPLRRRSEAATPKVRPDAGDRQGRSSEPPARANVLAFADREGVGMAEERREIAVPEDPGARAKRILEELAAGPKGKDLARTIPKDTTIRSVVFDDAGGAFVDFSRELVANHPAARRASFSRSGRSSGRCRRTSLRSSLFASSWKARRSRP